MTYPDPKADLLAAALPHVAFDGWTEETFRAAVQDSGVDPTVARAVCPRGALDLAVAYHMEGDRDLSRRLKTTDLSEMRFRDRIAQAVRWRLEWIEDKEAARRATTLFALPNHAADGSKLVWNTAHVIWEGLGDTSTDYNYYTKRATLSGVYASTVLFWLGDDSVDHQATWDFLDRRIDNVMQIETVKAQVRKNPVLSRLAAVPEHFLSRIKAPTGTPDADLPGAWRGDEG